MKGHTFSIALESGMPLAKPNAKNFFCRQPCSASPLQKLQSKTYLHPVALPQQLCRRALGDAQLGDVTPLDSNEEPEVLQEPGIRRIPSPSVLKTFRNAQAFCFDVDCE
jgi:hypothetical protein